MRLLRSVRLVAFGSVLVAASWMPVSAMDEDCAPSCVWCSSGSPCYLPGGDPDVCDQWDVSAPWESCDWAGTFCSSGGNTFVKCECLECEG